MIYWALICDTHSHHVIVNSSTALYSQCPFGKLKRGLPLTNWTGHEGTRMDHAAPVVVLPCPCGIATTGFFRKLTFRERGYKGIYKNGPRIASDPQEALRIRQGDEECRVPASGNDEFEVCAAQLILNHRCVSSNSKWCQGQDKAALRGGAGIDQHRQTQQTGYSCSGLLQSHRESGVRIASIWDSGDSLERDAVDPDTT